MNTWHVAHEHNPATDRFDATRQVKDVLHDRQAGPRVDLDFTPVLVGNDELDHESRFARRARGAARL